MRAQHSVAENATRESTKKETSKSPVQAMGELGEGIPLPAGRPRSLAALVGAPHDVSLHVGPKADDVARSHSVRGFSYGSHVGIRSDEYAPGTLRGDAILAHELAHSAQQARGSFAAGGIETEADADCAALAALVGRPATVRPSGLRFAGCNGQEEQARAALGREYGDTPIQRALWEHAENSYDPTSRPAAFTQGNAQQEQPLAARLDSEDASDREAALAELRTRTGRRLWRSLLLLIDSPHDDVRSEARARLGAAVESDPEAYAWLIEAGQRADLLADLATQFLVSHGRGGDLDEEAYRNTLVQRIQVVRAQARAIDERAYQTIAVRIGHQPPRQEPFATPALDELEAQLAGSSLAELSEVGARVATLQSRVGVARSALDELDALTASTSEESPIRPMIETQMLLVLLPASRLTGTGSDEQWEQLTQNLSSWNTRLATRLIAQARGSLESGRDRIAEAIDRPSPHGSMRSAWEGVRQHVLVPLHDQLQTTLEDFDRMEAAVDEQPDAALRHLSALEPTLQSLAERLHYATLGIQMADQYAHLWITDESQKDVMLGTELRLKEHFADFMVLAAMRDTNPEQAAQLYDELVEGEEFQDTLEDLEQWQEFLDAEARTMGFLAEVMIIVASLYTGGLAGGLLRGLLGRGVTMFGRAAIGTAVFATEVTTFHLTSRGLRWATFDQPFYDDTFFEELGETALLFGFLRGVNAAYGRFVAPRLPRALRGVGQHTATFVAFQAWAVGRYTWEHEDLPSSEQFWRMAEQNAMLLGAIHLGMKATQPLVSPVQGRVARFQLARHNARCESLRSRIETWRQAERPGEREGLAILRRARSLYLERIDVLRAIRSSDPSQLSEGELAIAETFLRNQAQACENATVAGRYRLQGVESDPNTFTYQGEAEPFRRHLEEQGYEILEADAITGRMRVRRPDGEVLDLIQVRRAVTGAGEYLTEAGRQAEATRVYEELRERSPRRTRVELDHIADNTGVPREVLARVRQHLFLNEYELPTGPGRTSRQRFDPLYEIAELWEAAEAGTLTEGQRAEFRSLLGHEYIEARLMELGMPYRSAHPGAYEGDVNFPRPEHFGAHDVAPLVVPGRPSFVHWRVLEMDTTRLPEGEPISHLDATFEAIVRTIAEGGRGYRLVTEADGTRRFEPIEPVPTTSGGPGPPQHGADPRPDPLLIDLWHGTSSPGAIAVRGGIRLDVGSGSPGRRQWGRGFYLGDRREIAETYAEQTESPTVMSGGTVDVRQLGEVLDVTTGEAGRRWTEWLEGPLTPVLPLTRGEVWRTQAEAREQLFEGFLQAHGYEPDVVVAPHHPEGARQVVIRTQEAAQRLEEVIGW